MTQELGLISYIEKASIIIQFTIHFLFLEALTNFQYILNHSRPVRLSVTGLLG